jgi:hypothetical protein
MQSLILNVEARSASVLDAVNWIGLAGKKIKAETVKKCFSKAESGESDVADNFEEARENTAATSNLCQGNELSCDAKDFVWSDDHLATHCSFEPATALLEVRNTQSEDVEEEVEEEEEDKQSENKIFQQNFVQTLHCISEVMQFAIDSNSSTFLELCIQLRTALKNT